MGKSPLALIAAIVGGLLAGAGLFSRLMNYELRRDEQLYVTPAVLLDHGRLYEDFFYNHVPGSAWLFRAVHEIAGAGGLLFSARLTIFFVWIAFAAILTFFTWRLTRSMSLAVIAAVLLVANDFLLGVAGAAATNNFLPLPFAFAGLSLFALGVRGEGIMHNPPNQSGVAPITIFAAGISLAIALSMKVSAVAFIAPVVIASFLMPRNAPLLVRLKTVFLPFAVGGIIGSAPVMLEFLRAPELFFAHVVQYHTGPQILYWGREAATDEGVATGLGAKALLAHDIWFSGVNLLILLGALIALATYALQGREGRGSLDLVILSIAVAASVAVFGFAPTPSFPQYFAPLSTALLFIIAVSAAPETGSGRQQILVPFVAIAVLALIVGAPRLAQHASTLATPSAWTVTKVHRAGIAMAAEMTKAGVDGKVLTLMPIYPLEGGLDVYPEFATGQFAYRTGDLMSDDLRRWYRTTAPSQIAAFLDADPPAAMLLGFEPELEAPMVDFARARGYRRVPGFEVDDRYGKGYLMLRSDRP